MISLEILIGILVFLCINFLFFRQIYVIFKSKISNGCLYISLILFLIQIVTVISSKFEYNGNSIEEFSNLFVYKIGVFLYYIGFHVSEIIAIIINQIIINKERKKITLKNKEKKYQNNEEDKSLNDLISRLEKEEIKEK